MATPCCCCWPAPSDGASRLKRLEPIPEPNSSVRLAKIGLHVCLRGVYVVTECAVACRIGRSDYKEFELTYKKQTTLLQRISSIPGAPPWPWFFRTERFLLGRVQMCGVCVVTSHLSKLHGILMPSLFSEIGMTPAAAASSSLLAQPWARSMLEHGMTVAQGHGWQPCWLTVTAVVSGVIFLILRGQCRSEHDFGIKAAMLQPVNSRCTLQSSLELHCSSTSSLMLMKPNPKKVNRYHRLGWSHAGDATVCPSRYESTVDPEG